eukprot:SAG11_NODE_1349_length_5137_cov_2.880905_6_plen_152_part_01
MPTSSMKSGRRPTQPRLAWLKPAQPGRGGTRVSQVRSRWSPQHQKTLRGVGRPLRGGGGTTPIDHIGPCSLGGPYGGRNSRKDPVPAPETHTPAAAAAAADGDADADADADGADADDGARRFRLLRASFASRYPCASACTSAKATLSSPPAR